MTARVTETDEPPDPDGCTGMNDVGSLHHNLAGDVWYECVFDSRRTVVTWAIIPAGEE